MNNLCFQIQEVSTEGAPFVGASHDTLNAAIDEANHRQCKAGTRARYLVMQMYNMGAWGQRTIERYRTTPEVV